MDISATDYLELQLLSAIFGFTYTAPAAWWLHISTTPLNDDGTGATEFSGSGYAPVNIGAFGAAVIDPFGSGGVTATPTLPIQFPQPTSTWWADFSTHIYLYLTDSSSGGTVLGKGDAGTGHGPKVDHPLVVTALSWNAGGWHNAASTGSFKEDWVKGAMDRITGAATWSGPPSAWVGIGGPLFAQTLEPWNTVFIGHNDFGDPNYARQSVGAWTSFLTTPSTSAGVTSCSNASDLNWSVTPDVPATPYTANQHWTANQGVTVWDGSSIIGSTALLVCISTNSSPAGGDTVKLPAGSIVFKWD